MRTFINNKIVDEEDIRIHEGTEAEVEEMMDSPSFIEDDGSQERAGVVKAPILNAFNTRGLATRDGSVGERRGGAFARRLLHLFLV